MKRPSKFSKLGRSFHFRQGAVGATHRNYVSVRCSTTIYLTDAANVPWGAKKPFGQNRFIVPAGFATKIPFRWNGAITRCIMSANERLHSLAVYPQFFQARATNLSPYRGCRL